ncbi:unnamed protein product [Ostreobium quekettii]|uniref:Uncharacterized protein n=1 Tax=Ostreobium quekettii TaxID=121088 RepID=A0A8S1J4H2_9CHLO|nr:unnamed protein product [Ostreobium quekettii]|eukprot:evm.model.scf_225.4 EVM.evm.TU.scf_225.4   scf_225:66481-70455(+)
MASAEPAAPAQLTEFQLERQRLIARNREKMQALGVHLALSELQVTAQEVIRRPPKKPRLEKSTTGNQPTRRSSRLANATVAREEQEALQAKAEEERLGQFIVDGTCPLCGGVFTRGHKKHLEECTGPTKVRAKRKAANYELLTPEERVDNWCHCLSRFAFIFLTDVTMDDGRPCIQQDPVPSGSSSTIFPV